MYEIYRRPEKKPCFWPLTSKYDLELWAISLVLYLCQDISKLPCALQFTAWKTKFWVTFDHWHLSLALTYELSILFLVHTQSNWGKHSCQVYWKFFDLWPSVCNDKQNSDDSMHTYTCTHQSTTVTTLLSWPEASLTKTTFNQSKFSMERNSSSKTGYR